jgi:hypothetical protein
MVLINVSDVVRQMDEWRLVYFFYHALTFLKVVLHAKLTI